MIIGEAALLLLGILGGLALPAISRVAFSLRGRKGEIVPAEKRGDALLILLALAAFALGVFLTYALLPSL